MILWWIGDVILLVVVVPVVVYLLNGVLKAARSIVPSVRSSRSSKRSRGSPTTAARST
jgi:nitric oxide reductase large subunit